MLSALTLAYAWAVFFSSPQEFTRLSPFVPAVTGSMRRVSADGNVGAYFVGKYDEGVDVVRFPNTLIASIATWAGHVMVDDGKLYILGGEQAYLDVYNLPTDLSKLTSASPVRSLYYAPVVRCFHGVVWKDTVFAQCEQPGSTVYVFPFASNKAVGTDKMTTPLSNAAICGLDTAKELLYLTDLHDPDAVNIVVYDVSVAGVVTEVTRFASPGGSCTFRGDDVFISSFGISVYSYLNPTDTTPVLRQGPRPSEVNPIKIIACGQYIMAQYWLDYVRLFDATVVTNIVEVQGLTLNESRRELWDSALVSNSFVVAGHDMVHVLELNSNSQTFAPPTAVPTQVPTPAPLTQTPGSVLEKWGSGFDSFSRGIAADTATKMYYVSSDSRGLLAVRFDHSAGTGQMNEVVAFEAATSEGVCLSSSGTRLYSFGDNTFSVKDVSDIYNTKTFTTMSSTNYNTVNNCSESVYNRGAVYAMCNITNGEGDFPSLALFNASDEGPQYKSTMRSGGGFCMDTERNLLFVVSRGFGSQVKPGDSITAYDVSDPFVLMPAFTVESPGEAVVRCAVQGKYLFLGGASGMLQVVDVSQAVPVRVDQGTCCSPNLHSIRTFAFIGHYGLSHDNLGEVAAIDLTDVTQPRIVHSIDMSHVGLGQSQVMDQYWLVVSETGVIPFRVDLPPTPAPPTGVPPTAAPLTPYPPTLSPPTPHPQTDAPPTAAPLTPHPPTDVPATTPPRTPSPPTDVPKTTPPLTLPPPTGVPDSTSPGTTSPLTLFPATQAPVTTSPLTQSPLTQPPLTQPPLTQSPPTPAPTAFPVTDVPPTVQPRVDRTTSAPNTVPPPTSDAPVTKPPATAAPQATAVATLSPPVYTFVRWCENDATCEVHGDAEAKCVIDKCACSQEKYNSLEGVNVCIAAPAGDVRSVVLVVLQWDTDCAKYDTKFDGYIISTLERELGGVAKGKERQCNEAVGVRLAIVMAGAETQKVAEVNVGESLESMYKLDERYIKMFDLGPVVSSMIIVSRSCGTLGSEVGLLDESGKCYSYACSPTYTLTAGVCVPPEEEGSSFPVVVVIIIVAVLLICSLGAFCFWKNKTQSFVPMTEEDADRLDSFQLGLVDHEKISDTQELGIFDDSPPTSSFQFTSVPTANTVTNTMMSQQEKTKRTVVVVSPHHTEGESINNTILQTHHAAKDTTFELYFDEMDRTEFGSISGLLGYTDSKHHRIGPFHNQSCIQWRTVKLLGSGAFGTVYSGTIGDGGHLHAMKVHTRKSEEEAQEAVTQVNMFRDIEWHRNVVSVHDVIYVCDTQTLCVFMDFVDGPTLATLAQAGMDEKEASRILLQVVAGLKHLHSHDLVHRDVKGENVLLSADRSVAKLCDFGWLKTLGGGTIAGPALSVPQTQGNTLAGTPGWMAPEVIDNGTEFVKSGKPADIYSVGCTLSEVQNKGVPPGPEVMNVWAWVAKEEGAGPKPLENIATGISPEATSFIEDCLQEDADKRPTIEELEKHPFFTTMSSPAQPDTTTNSAKFSWHMRMEQLTQKEMGSWAQTDTLGEGSFGTVYLGQLPDARQVAVKVITVKSKGNIAELRRQAEAEFRLLETLQHPNIVQCLGHNWSGGQLQIFMELVTGGTVRNLVKRTVGSRLMDSVVCVYTKQVLEALQYLHGGANGRPAIAHRDIKGDNLLIDREGTIKLADFGCSKLFEAETGGSGAETFVGTPNWMAPEVLRMRGESGTRSYGTKCDIWSLGCTIIEMMGHMPWRTKDCTSAYEVMRRIDDSTGGPPLPKGVAPSLVSFLAACFKRDPEERASADTLLESQYIVDGVDGTSRWFPRGECIEDGPLL